MSQVPFAVEKQQHISVFVICFCQSPSLVLTSRKLFCIEDPVQFAVLIEDEEEQMVHFIMKTKVERGLLVKVSVRP